MIINIKTTVNFYEYLKVNLLCILLDDSVDDSDGLIVADWNEQISKLFLVGDMPREFFDFWAFCKKQNPRQPEGIL